MNTILKYFLFLFLFISGLSGALAQVDKAQITTAYINNFARYTTWPNENQLDSFRIAVFTENSDIITALQKFSKNRKIKNKPISLTVYKSFHLPKNMQIILLMNDKSDYLSDLYDSFEGKPVLLISEEYQNKRNIMINLHETSKKQLKFEVNKTNVVNQGLIIDPEILLAGGTEIDVSGLYRESQINLRNIQKKIDKMKDSLAYLSTNIKSSENLIIKQQSELSKQLLESSKQKGLITESEKKIETYQTEILLQKVIMNLLKDSISGKNNILLKQTKEIKKQRHETDKMDSILHIRQKQIEGLNSEIKDKNITLGSQSKTIVRQKQTLLFSLIIVLLVIILVVIFFIGYRMKKRSEMNLMILNQTKNKFFSIISHDLRGPINALFAITDQMTKRFDELSKEEMFTCSQKLLKSTENISILLENLLQWSLSQTGRIDFKPMKLNLYNIVVRQISSRITTEKQINFLCHIPTDIFVYTDVNVLKTVLRNLLNNACKFSYVGGTVEIFCENKDTYYEVHVSDTGVGISPEDILKLFRLDIKYSTIGTANENGSGLGLILCKELLDKNGEKIWVESVIGKGSIFKFTLKKADIS